jgi:hypothetical protein
MDSAGASCRLIVGADGRLAGAKRPASLHRVQPIISSPVCWSRARTAGPDVQTVGAEGDVRASCSQGGGRVPTLSRLRQRPAAPATGATRAFLGRFRLRSLPAASTSAPTAGPCSSHRTNTWTDAVSARHVVLIGDAASSTHHRPGPLDHRARRAPGARRAARRARWTPRIFEPSRPSAREHASPPRFAASIHSTLQNSSACRGRRRRCVRSARCGIRRS